MFEPSIEVRSFFQSGPIQPLATAAVLRWNAVTSVDIVWESADRETLFKASSQQRNMEDSGRKIRSFLSDSELFLTLCNQPRDPWGFFIYAWLGSVEPKPFHGPISLIMLRIFRCILEV